MDHPTSPVIMDGTALATTSLRSSAQRAAAFAAQYDRAPCLAAVLVGDDPSSVTYVRMKQRRCAANGVDSRVEVLPTSSTTGEVISVLSQLSQDSLVDGILLQHPVPRHVDERAAFEAIDPSKDVDGVTTQSFATAALGLPGFRSCTPLGIMRLLDEYGVDLSGSHAVVLGRSPILGKPVGMMLLARDATVTFCHSHTRDVASIVRTADLVVAAVGRAGFVQGSWLQRGAVVIDAGYSNGRDGDVDYAQACAVAGMITPVPGGVGPMTIAMLIEQTIDAAFRARAVT